VGPQEEEKNDRCQKKVAMNILQHERKLRLAAVVAAGTLAHRARRRIQKESPIISLSVIVAGRPEAERKDEDQQGWGQRPPVVMRNDEGRIERRKVRPPRVELPFEGAKGGVHAEASEYDHDRKNLRPPGIAPHRAAESYRHNSRTSGLSQSPTSESNRQTK